MWCWYIDSCVDNAGKDYNILRSVFKGIAATMKCIRSPSTNLKFYFMRINISTSVRLLCVDTEIFILFL